MSHRRSDNRNLFVPEEDSTMERELSINHDYTIEEDFPNSNEEHRILLSGNEDGEEMPTDIDDFHPEVNDNDMIIIPTQDPTITSNDKHIPTIDLDAEEQQVVEILDDEEDDMALKKSKKPPESYKPIKEYKCPICFESPDMAMMTECGHVFCLDCLFQMVNNSNTSRYLQHSTIGLCALCRSKVDLRKITLLKLKRKTIQRDTKILS